MPRCFLCFAALASLLAAGAGMPAFCQVPPDGRPDANQAAPRVVLTFPFENTGQEPELEWLSEALSELTIERLSRGGYYLLSRQERLDTLEEAGLPASNRFSRATMYKLGERSDADDIIFGKYASDGSTLTVSAHVMQLSPPSLSAEFVQSGALADLLAIHARLAAQLDCALARPRLRPGDCAGGRLPVPGYLQAAASPSAEALESYIRGLTESSDQARVQNLRQAAKLQPDWDAPVFELGDYYFSRRNCVAALPLLVRVPLASLRGARAAFEAGACYLMGGDPARAQAALEPLVNGAKQGRWPEARNNLGVALARQGKVAEAIAAFEAATEDEPGEADYWTNLGLARLRSQNFDSAAQALRRASGLQPGDNAIRMLLAFALEQSGRTEEAAAERAKVTAVSARPVIPRNPVAADFARFDRIRMRLEAGALRPGSQQAELAGAEDGLRGPQRLALHLQRGREYLESGNLEDAQRAFIEALLLAPLDASAHSGLAEVYDREGRPSDAVREYRAALASRQDTATRMALAEVLLRLDRVSEARNEIEAVLKREPSNAKARELMERANNRSAPGAAP